MENIMQWIKAVDKQPKYYLPVLCLLENIGDETRFPLVCYMNVDDEWLDMRGHKIDERSVQVCYWSEIPSWPLDNVVPCSIRDEDVLAS